MNELSPHFTLQEARCRHCGKAPARTVLYATAQWLEEVRVLLGERPVHVNSWYRCPVHNAAIGGAPNSQHLKGLAVDITVKELTPRQVQQRLQRHQGLGKLIGGMGFYKGFTHVDRGPARTWTGE
jgi:uncharacterized protein YcbK (DUF882 family)